MFDVNVKLNMPNADKSGVCGFGSKRLIFPLEVPFPGK